MVTSTIGELSVVDIDVEEGTDITLENDNSYEAPQEGPQIFSSLADMGVPAFLKK